MTQPWTLERIRALTDPGDQVEAVREYDAQIAAKQGEAHIIRDQAILKMLADDTPTSVARRVRMSVSHVKSVWRADRLAAPAPSPIVRDQ
jgi:hypothetical protein